MLLNFATSATKAAAATAAAEASSSHARNGDYNRPKRPFDKSSHVSGGDHKRPYNQHNNSNNSHSHSKHSLGGGGGGAQGHHKGDKSGAQPSHEPAVPKAYVGANLFRAAVVPATLDALPDFSAQRAAAVAAATGRANPAATTTASGAPIPSRPPPGYTGPVAAKPLTGPAAAHKAGIARGASAASIARASAAGGILADASALSAAAAAATGFAAAANGDNAAGASGAGKGGSKTGFRALGLAEKLCAHLDSIGFTRPTVVQSLALPALCGSGLPRDCLVKSQTGSGKTLAFLLPIIQHLAAGPEEQGYERWARDAGTKALVLSPTRELALQIEQVWKQVAKPYYWIIATTLLGGENKKSEKARLRKGVHVVIGTPGRVYDHMETTKAWSLAGVRWFIMDEADRLMDLGFEESVTNIFEMVDTISRKSRVDPTDRRRNVLVSATLGMGSSLERMAQKMLTNPLKVGFGDEEADGGSKGKDGKKDKKDKKADAADGETAGAEAAEAENDVDDSDSDYDVDTSSAKTSTTTITNADSSDNSDDDSSSDSDSGDSDDDEKALKKKRAAAAAAAAAATTTVHATPTTLQQLYVTMSTRHRLVALASFLRLRTAAAKNRGVPFKAIVFISTCASVEFLHRILAHTFWPDVESAHSRLAMGGAGPSSTTGANPHGNNKPGVAGAPGSGKTAPGSGAKSQQAQQAPAAPPAREPLLTTPMWKLHGSLPQKQRTATYFEFCAASEGVLFCTDVAARGLDLPAVDWIVQYDPPEDVDDYVHRVGRTARFGRQGQAIIFLVESEAEYVTVLLKKGIQLSSCPLERILGGLHVGLTPNQLSAMTLVQPAPESGQTEPYRVPAGAVLQKQLEAMVSLDEELAALAREAYMSFLRAYSAYPKVLKPIFHPKRLHLGEVAHSFALLETPKGMGKKAQEVHEQTQAIINPIAAAKAKADAAKAEAKKKRDSSLSTLSKKADARADVQEFM